MKRPATHPQAGTGIKPKIKNVAFGAVLAMNEMTAYIAPDWNVGDED